MIRTLQSLLLASLLLLLGGCMAYEEAQSYSDFVIGKGYTPQVDKVTSYVPKRILMLPVCGPLDDRYKKEFINTFRSVLNDQTLWTVIDWPDGSLGGSKLQILSEEAHDAASRLDCDAILFVRLEDVSIYPPLRICVRFSLERVSDQQVIASSFQDYDSNKKNVANSARSFYQTRLNRHEAPDKSMIILKSNPPFMKYAATASAESLKNSLSSSK